MIVIRIECRCGGSVILYINPEKAVNRVLEGRCSECKELVKIKVLEI